MVSNQYVHDMSETGLQRFGNRLKELRTLRNMPQEELAGRANLNRTYISLIERGKRNPSLMCLMSISAALGISLRELCSLDSEGA